MTPDAIAVILAWAAGWLGASHCHRRWATRQRGARDVTPEPLEVWVRDLRLVHSASPSSDSQGVAQ